MKPSKETQNEFYQNLGKLFYAVAMADNSVRPVEVSKLRQDVKRYWLDVDDIEDDFGTDAAYQIEIVFDWLQEEQEESSWYYQEFVDFFKEHPSKFNDKVRHLILKTADDIAASFASRNKSELVLLGKLKLLLDRHSSAS